MLLRVDCEDVEHLVTKILTRGRSLICLSI